MVKSKIYPSYTNNYYYNEGDDFIKLVRTKSAYGGASIYKHSITFDTPDEVAKYFEEECGA
ncbi:hypothetical protein [Clostridium sp. 001]|uniref:hypothetical protein n=1 Tax=Clostridium sp. 001 TaxID=1970093 RepID=UPI001C2C60D2|nr:hypothetical protein [Clostridium sp. 001]QXE19981.1 hypothetical protein B5S50_14755 [Clostridium sp. 001]